MASDSEFFYGKENPSVTTALELITGSRSGGENRDNHWLWSRERRQEREPTKEEPGQGNVIMTTFVGLR